MRDPSHAIQNSETSCRMILSRGKRESDDETAAALVSSETPMLASDLASVHAESLSVGDVKISAEGANFAAGNPRPTSCRRIGRQRVRVRRP